MNKHDNYDLGDKIENKWDQAKGWMKEKWGWLTDNDFLELEGNKQKIQAKIRDHFGEEKWEEEYKSFIDEYPEYRIDE